MTDTSAWTPWESADKLPLNVEVLVEVRWDDAPDKPELKIGKRLHGSLFMLGSHFHTEYDTIVRWRQLPEEFMK